MKINLYGFDIYYKNGKKHANADAMSMCNGEKRNRGAEETIETIESGTGNQVEMGVLEAEQGEEKEEERTNEIEEEISEDEILLVQRISLQGGAPYKKTRLLPNGRKIEERGTPSREIEPQPGVVTETGGSNGKQEQKQKTETEAQASI
jgi:hypothetical protein